MFHFLVKKVREAGYSWDKYSPDVVEFYEPLGEKTTKLKRNLLIASIFIILVYSFGVEVTSFSGVKFNNINGTSDIGGILVWFLLYELFSFFISFYSDLKAWDYQRSLFNSQALIKSQKSLVHHLRKAALFLDERYSSLEYLRAEAKDVDDLNYVKMSLNKLKMSLMNFNDESHPAPYGEGASFNESFECFTAHIENLNTTKKHLRSKKVLTYVFDFLMPVTLAFLSLYLSFEDGLLVIAKVYGAL